MGNDLIALDRKARRELEQLLAAGTVIGECRARHRADEFLSFLKTIDRESPHISICI